MSRVVGKSDETAGELPVAFVQLKAGHPATAEELIAFVNDKVGAYKKLREVVLAPLVPVSAAGKVLKRELRDQLTGA
jgi:long-chain acyl-CoA synthetase